MRGRSPPSYLPRPFSPDYLCRDRSPPINSPAVVRRPFSPDHYPITSPSAVLPRSILSSDYRSPAITSCAAVILPAIISPATVVLPLDALITSPSAVHFSPNQFSLGARSSLITSPERPFTRDHFCRAAVLVLPALPSAISSLLISLLITSPLSPPRWRGPRTLSCVSML